MSKYDFSLGGTVTKNGAPFVTQQPTTWHGIDDAAMAKMISLSDHVLGHLHKAADKGGPLAVALARSVVALDGGDVDPKANGTVNVSGVTYRGLVDYQEALHDAGRDLLKMGREHANKKDKK